MSIGFGDMGIGWGLGNVQFAISPLACVLWTQKYVDYFILLLSSAFLNLFQV